MASGGTSARKASAASLVGLRLMSASISKASPTRVFTGSCGASARKAAAAGSPSPTSEHENCQQQSPCRSSGVL